MQTVRGSSPQLSTRMAPDGGVRAMLPAPPAIRSLSAAPPFSPARPRHLAPGAVRRSQPSTACRSRCGCSAKLRMRASTAGPSAIESSSDSTEDDTDRSLALTLSRGLLYRSRRYADVGAGGRPAVACPRHTGARSAVPAVSSRSCTGAACGRGQRNLERWRLPGVPAESAGRLLRSLGRRPGGMPAVVDGVKSTVTLCSFVLAHSPSSCCAVLGFSPAPVCVQEQELPSTSASQPDPVWKAIKCVPR